MYGQVGYNPIFVYAFQNPLYDNQKEEKKEKEEEKEDLSQQRSDYVIFI